MEDLNKFRVGAYGDADDDTKEKWCKVMLYFLPSVSSKYNKPDVGMAVRASEASTSSDEALVMWLVRFNAKAWEKEKDIEDLQEASENTESEAATPKTKIRKPKGAHMSQEQLQVFLDLMIDIDLKRGMSEGGKDWDDALILAAQQEHDNTKGNKGIAMFDDAVVGTSKAVDQPRVLIPYQV